MTGVPCPRCGHLIAVIDLADGTRHVVVHTCQPTPWEVGK